VYFPESVKGAKE